jgi:hypothetical protein
MIVELHTQSTNLSEAGYGPSISDRLISPAAIRYESFQQGEMARQIIIFESSHANSKVSQCKGTALVEMADNRVFFFRFSLGAMQDSQRIDLLLNKLVSLREWVIDWKKASEYVGYFIEAPLEFINKDPSIIENWNTQDWKQQAASWLAVNHPQMSIQQIRKFTAEISNQFSEDLISKIGLFFSRLDPYACVVAKDSPGSWQATYNFFTPVNEQQRLYRRQAEKIFPTVVQQILAYPEDDSSSSIRIAIDSGIPLIDYIAKLFSCSKASVRHLNGRRYEELGNRWLGRIKELLMVLSGLNINRLPKEPTQWKVLSETIDLLRTMTKMPTTSISSRMLLVELSKLYWKQNISTSVSYQERALTIERFTENISHSIVATGWTNGNGILAASGVVQRLAAEVACSLGLTRLENLSRKWRLAELHHEIEMLPKNKRDFPIMLDTPLEVGGMKVLQLTNPMQLAEEGVRMGNCVATYSAQCATGNAYIFSIRDASEESCATIEYRLSRSATGLPEFILIQKKGFQNESPDVKCDEALHALHRYTKSPDSRHKMLTLVVYQKASEFGGADMANKYLRSLTFMKFLEKEAAGRINFEQLVAKAIEQEKVFQQL